MFFSISKSINFPYITQLKYCPNFRRDYESFNGFFVSQGFPRGFPRKTGLERRNCKMHFVRILLGISQEHRFRGKKLQNAFCKDFRLFNSIL